LATPLLLQLRPLRAPVHQLRLAIIGQRRFGHLVFTRRRASETFVLAAPILLRTRPLSSPCSQTFAAIERLDAVIWTPELLMRTTPRLLGIRPLVLPMLQTDVACEWVLRALRGGRSFATLPFVLATPILLGRWPRRAPLAQIFAAIVGAARDVLVLAAPSSLQDRPPLLPP